jgi:choline dehydrogenase-like flavoprotein
VLVLEAGGSDRNPLIQMPAGFVKLLGVEKYMWFYQSTVQQRLHGRQPVVPTGRVIGGGSSVNAMVYIRGQAADYDALGRGDRRSGLGLARAAEALQGDGREQPLPTATCTASTGR